MQNTQVIVPDDWVTPEMLEWARKQIGLDVDEVASKIDLDAAKIRAWEIGEVSPSLADLEILSEVYDCPVGYFFLDSPPESYSVSLDYRGLAQGKENELSYETRKGLRGFLRLVEFASTLIEQMNIKWQIALTEAEIERPVEEVVNAAVSSLGINSEIRSRWSSAEDAYNGWKSAIEGQGVLVLASRLAVSELRGASLWNPPGPPAILVNHSDIEAATGRTFTLLHEYAHLIVRHSGIVCDFRGRNDRGELEQFANRFAAEALVPISRFKEILQQEGYYELRSLWGDKTLDRLRAPFGASRDVVLILLQELNLAPQGYYVQKRAAWDKRRQFFSGASPSQIAKPTKVQQKVREFGVNLSRLLVNADERDSISKLDLASILDIPVERVTEFAEEVRKK